MQTWLVALSAFAGALTTVAAILLLSTLRRLTPASLILAGVALSALFGAATMFLQYFSTDSQLAATVFWAFGDLGRAGWRDILLMAAVLAPGLAYFLWNSWGYNALSGATRRPAAGVSVGVFRLRSLVISALVAAVTVACLGVIGFVGLVAPTSCGSSWATTTAFCSPVRRCAARCFCLPPTSCRGSSWRPSSCPWGS